MNLYLIYSRKARGWVILVALMILCLCIAAFVRRESPEPLGIDELYGLLD
jgi:hypothetical protein